MKLKVYVAGPMSGMRVGDMVNNAVTVADEIVAAGHVPYVPHFNILWSIGSEQARSWSGDQGLEYDFEWLAVCDVLWRLKGESDGADKEVEYAKEHGIYIVYDTYGLAGAALHLRPVPSKCHCHEGGSWRGECPCACHGDRRGAGRS